MKLRVYDLKGQERWVGPGQIVPSGWYNSKFESFDFDQVVILIKEDGNPYDQFSKDKYFPCLVKKDLSHTK